MSTVVQTTYRPQLAAAVAGMIADEASAEVGTRQVETAAGIGFGVAVSQGVNDKGCIVGGTAFIGITVRDVAQDRIPIDPLSSTEAAADVYPQYSNAAILSRGDIWVVASATVTAGAALYYGSDGTFGLSGGEQAYGSITFTEQPVAGQTVTIDGTTVTFEASGATGNQVNLGATLGDTIDNLVTMLNASADANLVTCKYAAYPDSPGGAGEGSGANTLQIAYKTAGTGGNAIAFSTNVTGATTSGSTLSGGEAAGTAVPGGYWKTSALAGNLAKVSLSQQR